MSKVYLKLSYRYYNNVNIYKTFVCIYDRIAAISVLLMLYSVLHRVVHKNKV